jgi:transposase
LRAEASRLPKEASKREALAASIGADGYQLMRLVFAAATPPKLRHVPAINILC